MNYSIYHPQGFYMCDIEIRDNESNVNKVQINEEGSANFNPLFPRWVKRPTPLALDLADSARQERIVKAVEFAHKLLGK